MFLGKKWMNKKIRHYVRKYKNKVKMQFISSYANKKICIFGKNMHQLKSSYVPHKYASLYIHIGAHSYFYSLFIH